MKENASVSDKEIKNRVQNLLQSQRVYNLEIRDDILTKLDDIYQKHKKSIEDILVGALTDKDFRVRILVALVLGRRNEDIRAVDTLLEAMNPKYHRNLRIVALSVLLWVPSSRSYSSLVGLLDEDDPEIRRLVIKNLKLITDLNKKTVKAWKRWNNHNPMPKKELSEEELKKFWCRHIENRSNKGIDWFLGKTPKFVAYFLVLIGVGVFFTMSCGSIGIVNELIWDKVMRSTWLLRTASSSIFYGSIIVLLVPFILLITLEITNKFKELSKSKFAWSDSLYPLLWFKKACKRYIKLSLVGVVFGLLIISYAVLHIVLVPKALGYAIVNLLVGLLFFGVMCSNLGFFQFLYRERVYDVFR